jgi:hypothetical protein
VYRPDHTKFVQDGKFHESFRIFHGFMNYVEVSILDCFKGNSIQFYAVGSVGNRNDCEHIYKSCQALTTRKST